MSQKSSLTFGCVLLGNATFGSIWNRGTSTLNQIEYESWKFDFNIQVREFVYMYRYSSLLKFPDEKFSTNCLMIPEFWATTRDVIVERALRATREFKLGDKSYSAASSRRQMRGTNMKIRIIRELPSGKTRKRKETRMNERTNKREKLSPDCFPSWNPHYN